MSEDALQVTRPAVSIPLWEMIKSIPNFLGIRTGETPEYDVVARNGNVEIRRYAPYMIASTFASGQYDESMDAAFRRLANYIFGDNIANDRMAMTTPVLQGHGRRITMSMTTPVLQERAANGWGMAFILPKKYTLANAPRPNDASIRLEQVHEKTIAALGYTGTVNEARLEKQRQALLRWISTHGWHAVGDPVNAQYDPPFTIPFLKRNEALVEVRK